MRKHININTKAFKNLKAFFMIFIFRLLADNQKADWDRIYF